MANKIILDFQSFTGINKSLEYFLGDKIRELREILHKKLNGRKHDVEENFYISEYEDKLNLDWDRVILKDLFLKIFHFTTRKQNVVVENIYNLSFLLSNKTDFRDFFEQHNIKFDIENQLMFLKEEVIDLSKEDLLYPFFNVRAKIYYDCEVWGFLKIKDFSKYNNEFPSRPEFVSNIASLLDNKNEFLANWAQTNGTPYVIEFIKPLGSTTIMTNLITDKKKYIKSTGIAEWELKDETENKKCELEIKRGLCDLLIDLYISHLTNSDHNELRVVLQNGENVYKNHITKVWEYADFQKTLES